MGKETRESRGEGNEMKNTVTTVLLLGVLCFPPVAGTAVAGETIGVVRSATGDATVTRGETSLPADPGLKIMVGDTLVTGRVGSLGVILHDDSTLSIGPGSRLVLRSFRFSPSEGKFALVTQISRGTMAYLSGLIGKLAPEAARFETPSATIGIRGTRFAVNVAEPSSR